MGRKYLDVGSYLGSGSNWLQPRPPVFNIRWGSKPSQAHPPHHISRYETGTSLPSIKTLLKIAKVLKKTSRLFLGGVRRRRRSYRVKKATPQVSLICPTIQITEITTRYFSESYA